MSLKVTILIPCYNAEDWIEKCILSALDQTYENTEVIFVDNESTDKSLEIARGIQKDHPELVISTAPNLYRWSWDEPVTEGLKLCTGDYITILGADDYIIPTYVANFMEYIEKAPVKILAFQSPIQGIEGKEETFLGEVAHHYKSMAEFKELLFQKSPVNTPTMVYSRELKERRLLQWDPQYLGAADYHLYFRLADKNVFIFPADRWLGYKYRWHPGQATWGMHKETTNYDDTIRGYWKGTWGRDD
tara:strand:+ start:1106 stop:1843 length:738 start_codon:yes stop_codon:yes gene_type:complete